MHTYTRHTRRSLIACLEDPRIWIALLFLIRLYLIDHPPFGEHLWRQTLTLGVARNYLEWDPNFLHPRTILCDSRTGILAQEFPLYNYLIFLGWKIFGQENWVFRIIGLLANSFGLFWFYRIVKSLFNHRAALSAMVIMGVSVTFSYTVRAMPDVFSLSLALGGVFYGWQFLRERTSAALNGILFLVLTTLGMLTKVPSAVVMTLLFIPFLDGCVTRVRKVQLVVLSVVALAPAVFWYIYWQPWIQETYGHPLYFPRTLSEGFQQLIHDANGTGAQFERFALQSRILFYVSVIGFLLLIMRKHVHVLITGAIYSMAFFFLMLKAGDGFSTHEYYVIPFVPLLSLGACYAMDTLLPKKPWALYIALIMVICIGLFR